MPQNVVLKAKGLYTHSNPLSATPDGSLAEAINVVIDRNDILEPRRGFNQYGNPFGTSVDKAKQLFNYKDTVLRHVLTSIEYDSDGQGAFLPFSGNMILEIEDGLRIKGVEANGNFYFCTATGIKKISAKTSADFATATVQDAGGVTALDLTTTTNYTSTGFFEANSTVAYRVVWGYKDINENLVLGAPSSRSVVTNLSSSSCIVNLSFAIPNEVDSTNYFYQIYRTAVFSETPPNEPPDPGEEMYLVFEDQVASDQLAEGIVGTTLHPLTDITPEDFRKNGTLLYINPVSGEGIEQANDKPPFAKDIAVYKNYTFYSNTKTVQRLNLSFLSVTGMTSNASTITVTDGTLSDTYTFQGTKETYTVDCTACGSSADFYNASSGTAKYFTISSSNGERSYYVWYHQSTDDEDPEISGKLGIKVEILNTDFVPDVITKTISQINSDTDDFNLSSVGSIITIVCANNGSVSEAPTASVTNMVITKDGLGTGEDSASKKAFLPRVPTGDENGPTTAMQLEQVARSLVKVINDNDSKVYARYMSGYGDVPGQILLERRTTTGDAFYVQSNVGNQFSPTVPSAGSSIISNNEISPNRIYYSKVQQPEAVPLANYIDIGPKDREIKRIIALRDSLFIFKEDGIYRLSGDTAPFTVAPFDFSAQVLAPDTAVVLNNQIYALSTQGVIVVTDTGVSVISRPIENQLLSIMKQGSSYKTASFGVAYETDRSYLLWTVSSSSDSVSTQCFRYNTFTTSWTKWDKTNTCGIINFADDKMYLGAGDINYIEKERKTLSRTDHADREYTLQVQLNGVDDDAVELSDTSNIDLGDVLIQRQYLTSLQFNRTLEKLDRDTGVADTDYLSTLQYPVGGNIRSSILALATKLDADTAVARTDFSSSIASETHTITDISVATQSILTIGAHTIPVGRYITISGSNSTPSIDGTWEVLSVTGTTVKIDRTVAVTGTAGTVQTADNDFRDVQSCFNIITNLLNTDTSVFYTNYPHSTGYVDFEVPIRDIDASTSSIIVQSQQPLMFGTITLYKAIRATVVWNPQFFQDPTVLKQIREGTMMFENSNFTLVTIGYGTDLSPAFEDVEFEGQGLGDWGQFTWSEQNWGGVGAPVPLRTLIPAGKQRCRFMNVRFKHAVAFEKYSLYGMSLTFRPYSTRGYK